MSADTPIIDNGRPRAIPVLFSYRGRIGRLTFLCGSLGGIVIALLAVYFSIAMAGNDRSTFVGVTSAILLVLAALALWPLTALLAKRLHDLNRSGWHSVWLIPLWLSPNLLEDALSTAATVAALVTLIAVAAIPGSRGPNAFGEAT